MKQFETDDLPAESSTNSLFNLSPRQRQQRTTIARPKSKATSIIEGEEPPKDDFFDFIEDGWISQAGTIVKAGKEAVVYRCLGGSRCPKSSVAVKVYKRPDRRSFKTMSHYLEGRFADMGLSRRETLHILATPGAIQSMWVEAEWSKLHILHTLGLVVPQVYARTGNAIAMEFIGDADPAPRLVDYPLTGSERLSMGHGVLANIRTMLENGIVHGDLSCYNILVHHDQAVIIDFPQAVDPAFNDHAYAMLCRDIQNILSFFSLHPQPEDHAIALATKWWQETQAPDVPL